MLGASQGQCPPERAAQGGERPGKTQVLSQDLSESLPAIVKGVRKGQELPGPRPPAEGSLQVILHAGALSAVSHVL